MTEAILLALWVGTALFFICREIKINANRKSQESWRSDLRECIILIEQDFRIQCRDKAEKYSIAYEYSASIEELKRQYLSELHSKIVAKKRITITTIPEDLVREYEREISEIADTYLELGNYINKYRVKEV